jgi:putative PEP-CTERM system histidine kinase
VGAALTTRSLYRTGHFELEVYPSRAVLQKSVTVFLAGAYLLIVGVLAKVVSYIGGDAAFAVKAFFIMAMVVLLALVIQSDRARLELRRFVSRNFRRSSYDYRAVWKTFTEGTASRVEQNDLCRGLVTLIAETFDALTVSIFLVDEKKEKLLVGASTNSSVPNTGDTNQEFATQPDAPLICERFQTQTHAVDIESCVEPWAVILKAKHPTQFANGGNRVCVPLIGRGDVQGVIVVGDRVAGIPFSMEDFEMLKCIADHAAASILNVQLSTKLLQAKELEAFQAMAAFFVHDLKNAASTLNLMLQNFPAHFDNPEFKQDALRGIGKTASHINRLVSRLGMLRHELKVEMADEDVNELVTSILKEIEHTPGYNYTKELGPLPPVRMDRDQMHKVVTNLVLNATEAAAPKGDVHVRTTRENGWVILTVADNGCGMSSEFLRHSLFRPFQTTKKNGLGIGMFQSKMIVEAHRGRIAVTSEVGKGTTFQIYLPTAQNSQ